MKSNWFKRAISATMFVAGAVFSPGAACAPLTPTTTQTAQAVIANWIQLGQDLNWQWTDDGRPPLIGALREITHEGELLGYAALLDHGYIVVPACTELPPITAYSTTSTLNFEDEGGMALLLRETLAYKLAAARAALAQPSPDPALQPVLDQIEQDRRQWQAYSGSYADFTTALARDNIAQGLDDAPESDNPYGITSVSPLLTVNWHQRWPYYNLNPLGDGGRAPLGCVATACAQILAYWRHPTSGSGSYSYLWNGDQSCGRSTPAQQLSASFSDTYDWANIQDSYDGTETPAQLAAVAELNHEVAVALQTDFGRCVSTAFTSTVAQILPAYFGYSSDIDREDRNDYTSASAWFSMLQQDLNEGWPMQYRIAGHSIVCDGWRVAGTQQYHMNYGWADSHTAWYTVDNLYCVASGCSPMVEYVIRRIHPAGHSNNPPQLTVTSPNGGEAWTLGATESITWNAANFAENVAIELNRAYPVGNWEQLTASTANDGHHTWTVSGTTSNSVRVRIRGTVTTAVGDTSNASFAITSMPSGGGIVMTMPNGGEMLVAGSTYRTRWNSENYTGNVRIELDRDYPSGNWETIIAVTLNDGGHTFEVTGPATSNARLRVLSLTQPGVGDTSNANFTIYDPRPWIRITSPDGGEVLTAGQNNRIYFAFGNLTGTLRIQINHNYPAGSWETIVAVTNLDGGHTWSVFGPPTDNARIRIISNDYPAAADTSNDSFSITAQGGSGGEGSAGPAVTELGDAYPNPFNPATTIRYSLAEAAAVQITVCDVTGRQVARLVDQEQPAGEYRVPFDGANLSAGTYFVQMRSGSYQIVRKLLLMK